MRWLMGTLLVMTACVADVGGVHQESQDGEDGNGKGSASDPTTTPTGYLEKIAGIYCEESFTCRASFPPDRGYTFEAQWGNTDAECRQKLITAWNPPEIEREIAKGRVTYDSGAARSCLDGVTFGSCPDYWSRGIEWAEACYHVLVGSVPSGGQCDIDYSCASFACDKTLHQCM
jgi:hypothetical protein